jgi:hypothetical protein
MGLLRETFFREIHLELPAVEEEERVAVSADSSESDSLRKGKPAFGLSQLRC